MVDEPQAEVARTVSTCYRHPNRETLVSCGRCGRPLCPDCLRHGPVGVRCDECLRPAPVQAQLAAPERVGLAIGLAVVLAVCWVAALAVAGWTVLRIGQLPTPNVLLAGVGGMLVGWLIWRICGRSWNRRTAAWAIGLGVAMPLLASLLLAGIWYATMQQMLFAYWVFDLRVAVATLVSALFAWLLSTQRHFEDELFDR